MKAPKATEIPTKIAHHGIVDNDEYAWLRARNWLDVLRSSEALEPAIRDHLEAENDYTDTVLKPLAGLRQKLATEMRARMQEEESEVPEKDGPYAYHWRYREGDEHPVLARTARDGGPESILLDAEYESMGQDYFELGECEVSPDHRLLAWSYDDTGAESYRVRIRDLATGEDLPVKLEGVDSLSWSTSGYLFYVQLDSAHRPSRVLRHSLACGVPDASADVLVMHEKDERFCLSVALYRNQRALEITSAADDQNEIWLIDVEDPEGPPKLISKRRPGQEYIADLHENRLIILTNSQARLPQKEAGNNAIENVEAADFRLVSTPRELPGESHWEEIIPHVPGCLRQEFFVYRDWLVWLELEAALPRIRYAAIDLLLNPVRAAEGALNIETIEFDEVAYVLELEPSPEFDTSSFRFTYSSPTTPETLYEFDLQSGDRQLLKQEIIPSGHDAADYRSERFSVPMGNGIEVPLTIFYHHTTVLNGSAPCLLYGYGAYGLSSMPEFSSTRLSLVDRGFVFAIAHVRGGEENGRQWYLQTRGRGKQRSFDDFIACARYLGSQELVDARNIVSYGGSAGGLLVAAAMHQVPELFRAVVASVPFVDALNTMLDETLPLTPGEWVQWGNPVTDKEAYQCIEAYSPYNQVREAAYPAILATASLADPRVGYWEAAKWVARLRAHKTDDNMVLLKTEMQGGHFGQSGRFGYLEEVALVYGFILWVTGTSDRQL